MTEELNDPEGRAAGRPVTVHDLLLREQTDPLLTLDQLAALVRRSKRTLEGYVNDPRRGMPRPEVEGGGGRAAYWRWSAVRPWLNATFGRSFPAVYVRF